MLTKEEIEKKFEKELTERKRQIINTSNTQTEMLALLNEIEISKHSYIDLLDDAEKKIYRGKIILKYTKDRSLDEWMKHFYNEGEDCYFACYILSWNQYVNYIYSRYCVGKTPDQLQSLDFSTLDTITKIFIEEQIDKYECEREIYQIRKKYKEVKSERRKNMCVKIKNVKLYENEDDDEYYMIDAYSFTKKKKEGNKKGERKGGRRQKGRK